MNTFEIVPVLSGVLLGSFLGYLRPGLRKWAALVFAILFGAAATLASGEYLKSWSYMLVDVGLVAVAAVAAFVVVQRLRWAR